MHARTHARTAQRVTLPALQCTIRLFVSRFFCFTLFHSLVDKWVVCRVDEGYSSTCEKHYFDSVPADTEDFCGCCDGSVPQDGCSGSSCCEHNGEQDGKDDDKGDEKDKGKDESKDDDKDDGIYD